MTRSDLHTAFAIRFSAARPKPVVIITETDLLAVEALLKITLPQSYISFVTAHGPLFTPRILIKLVDAHEAGRPTPGGSDVQEFFSPPEIFETHQLYVSGGMDDSVVPFAMDSGGSIFGFQRVEALERPDDLPVLFFDHDYCEVRVASASFDTWIGSFLLIES